MKARAWSNVVLGTVLAFVAYVSLRAPVRKLTRASRSQLGAQMLLAGDSAGSLDGRRHPLLSPVGLTIVAMIDPEDSTTRAHAAAVASFLEWTRLQGMSPQLVVAINRGAAAAFGRDAGIHDQLRLADSSLVRRWSLTALPVVMILDSAGRVQARWLGMIPRHLDMLNVLGKLEY